jgi:hypothetical protein
VKIGDVVSVITVAGEIVGRLQGELDGQITISDPRLFVQMGDRAGFMPGVATTGEVNLKEITIKDYIAVVPSNKESTQAWQKITSGIILA